MYIFKNIVYTYRAILLRTVLEYWPSLLNYVKVKNGV